MWDFNTRQLSGSFFYFPLCKIVSFGLFCVFEQKHKNRRVRRLHFEPSNDDTLHLTTAATTKVTYRTEEPQVPQLRLSNVCEKLF